MEKRKIICTCCPMGCHMEVTIVDGKVTEVTGNTCKRGEDYAKNECINPVRTVTSTVKCEDGKLISVKTDRPIPKHRIPECMKIINTTVAANTISIGDIVVKDVFGSNIVATSSRNT